MASTISAGTTAGTAIAIAGDTTGNLAFQTNGTTTAMTIDTSQNVGIGTTSPARNLVVKGTTGLAAERSIDTDRMTVTYDAINQFANASGANNYNTWSFTQSNNSGSDVRMQISSAGVLSFNSGYGSAAAAYGCRAWVNFNGTGTPAIRASGNVSSITDNGTGAYAINFSTAMPDANYGANVSVCGMPGVSDANFITTDQNNTSRVAPTTTAFSMTAFRFQGSPIDPDYVRVSVFR